jgi:Cu/Ag efflux protein CusF
VLSLIARREYAWEVMRSGVVALYSQRRSTMRMLIGAVLATALLGAASVAYAADATGKIKSLDMTKDMVTLDSGSSYMAPKSVKLSDFKVGQKVTVSYTKAGDKMDVTSIKPAT